MEPDLAFTTKMQLIVDIERQNVGAAEWSR